MSNFAWVNLGLGVTAAALLVIVGFINSRLWSDGPVPVHVWIMFAYVLSQLFIGTMLLKGGA